MTSSAPVKLNGVVSAGLAGSQNAVSGNASDASHRGSNKILYIICRGSTVYDRVYAGVYSSIQKADAVISLFPGCHIEWATADEWQLELDAYIKYHGGLKSQ